MLLTVLLAEVPLAGVLLLRVPQLTAALRALVVSLFAPLAVSLFAPLVVSRLTALVVSPLVEMLAVQGAGRAVGLWGVVLLGLLTAVRAGRRLAPGVQTMRPVRWTTRTRRTTRVRRAARARRTARVRRTARARRTARVRWTARARGAARVRWLLRLCGIGLWRVVGGGCRRRGGTAGS
ncbi:hypothetical protein GCM10009804_37510 [Kribbella hippodromi]|uniref:Uncharacterized protein n=1 Tax=Kribbella hippodromi TaxID=434347 RepID=A0ABP4PC20_9ACTN